MDYLWLDTTVSATNVVIFRITISIQTVSILVGAWGIPASQDFRGSKLEDEILRIGLKNMRIVYSKMSVV